MNDATHRSVMLQEAVELLSVKPDNWYIDATFGRGGHTQAILEKGGKVVAFDFDEAAIEAGKTRFKTQIDEQRLILVRENFSYLFREIDKILQQHLNLTISGVLFDFGTSSEQLTSTDRGFSFSGQDEPLDMRLDQRLGVTAADMLAVLSERQLTEIFAEYGGEERARAIAKAVIKERGQGNPPKTVRDLVRLVDQVKGPKKGYLHPSTKVFQALRVAVNTELENIEQALPQALELLPTGGRIITIAFHEGEDRIAKHVFRTWEDAGKGVRTPKDALVPTEREINNNPRARSAKLRVFTKR